MIIKNEHINTSTIVIFSSRLGDHVDNINPHEFLRTLGDFNTRLVFVSDSSGSWYRDGIDDSSGVEDTITIISRAISGKTLFMGHSAGGYAAMFFGSLIGADNVLAFSPQTVLDHRWEDFIPHENFYSIVKNSLCDMTIVYCDRHENDLIHIEPFVKYARVKKLDCDKHNSAKHAVKETDFLQQYINDFLGGD